MTYANVNITAATALVLSNLINFEIILSPRLRISSTAKKARRRGFFYPRDSLFSVATPVDCMLRPLIESSAGTKDQQRAELYPSPLAEESSFQVKRNTHCRSRNFGRFNYSFLLLGGRRPLNRCHLSFSLPSSLSLISSEIINRNYF